LIEIKWLDERNESLDKMRLIFFIDLSKEGTLPTTGGGRPRAGSGPEYALLIVTYLFNGFVMNEFPQEIVDFDNKAKKIFFSLYENFAESAKQLDRKKDDNVFQQQQSKYLKTLKTQLENLAQDLLNKNSSLKNINLLNKKLRDEINIYLNEFRQKSRSL